MHFEKCVVPTDKYTVGCVFHARHAGEHAAQVGLVDEVADHDLYLYWQIGVTERARFGSRGTVNC